MQKRLLIALVGIALLMTLCMNALATNADLSTSESTAEAIAEPLTLDYPKTETSEAATAPDLLDAAYETLALDAAVTSTEAEQSKAGADFIVNGVSIEDAKPILVGDTTYISIRTIVQALDPTAKVSWQDNQLLASGKGFSLSARPGDLYMIVNGRYLYVPDGILFEDETTLAPIRTLCYALGASTKWEVMTQNISVTTTGSPLASGSSYYDSNELHWMSRIISAESKNQPLKGKVAVGTVIMNRVESPKFPDTIYDVIFSGTQFSPVSNGSIHQQPTAESVIAAKLVLDGAREAGSSLFFHRAGLNSWAARNKTFVTTIADHSFYQ